MIDIQSFFAVLRFIITLIQFWSRSGKIIEIIPGKKVTLEREDGHEFVILFKRIFAITNTENLEQRQQELKLHMPDKLSYNWENVTMIGLRCWKESRWFSVSVYSL